MDTVYFSYFYFLNEEGVKAFDFRAAISAGVW